MEEVDSEADLYYGHEYSLDNLNFCKFIDTDNIKIID